MTPENGAYGVPADVPESAVFGCGKAATHARHDWIEPTGPGDYEHYWCPGVMPQSAPESASS